MSRVEEVRSSFKTCGCCKESLPIGSFGLHKQSSDGFRSYCKPCWNSYKTKWRVENRELFDAQTKRKREKQQHPRDPLQFNINQRKWRLKRVYGISEEIFQEMLIECGGRCQCCGRVPIRGKWCVDHDHKTGEVRGLLCGPCNSGIGLLGDTAERMELAADYLNGKRHAVVS